MGARKLFKDCCAFQGVLVGYCWTADWYIEVMIKASQTDGSKLVFGFFFCLCIFCRFKELLLLRVFQRSIELFHIFCYSHKLQLTFLKLNMIAMCYMTQSSTLRGERKILIDLSSSDPAVCSRWLSCQTLNVIFVKIARAQTRWQTY